MIEVTVHQNIALQVVAKAFCQAICNCGLFNAAKNKSLFLQKKHSCFKSMWRSLNSWRKVKYLSVCGHGQ